MQNFFLKKSSQKEEEKKTVELNQIPLPETEESQDEASSEKIPHFMTLGPWNKKDDTPSNRQIFLNELRKTNPAYRRTNGVDYYSAKVDNFNFYMEDIGFEIGFSLKLKIKTKDIILAFPENEAEVQDILNKVDESQRAKLCLFIPEGTSDKYEKFKAAGINFIQPRSSQKIEDEVITIIKTVIPLVLKNMGQKKNQTNVNTNTTVPPFKHG